MLTSLSDLNEKSNENKNNLIVCYINECILIRMEKVKANNFKVDFFNLSFTSECRP